MKNIYQWIDENMQHYKITHDEAHTAMKWSPIVKLHGSQTWTADRVWWVKDSKVMFLSIQNAVVHEFPLALPGFQWWCNFSLQKISGYFIRPVHHQRPWVLVCIRTFLGHDQGKLLTFCRPDLKLTLIAWLTPGLPLYWSTFLEI